jgi:hypothetical protein
MKKLLLFFALIPFFGFSQQVLKRITDGATHTVVEFFVLANGNTSTQFIGNNEFLEVAHLNYFGFTYFETLGNELGTFQPNDTIYPAHNIQNISFCNETFQNNTVIYNIRKDFRNSNNTAQLNISTIETAIEGDALSDDNFGNDLLYYKVELPKLLDDGNAVPLNTRAIVSTARGDLSEFTHLNGLAFFRFDGFAWNSEPELDWPDVCGSLSISESENLENKISIYPNPASLFITIANKSIPAETFEYNIVDLKGSIVAHGNSRFNEKINVANLTSGNYFIRLKIENTVIVKKIIKI